MSDRYSKYRGLPSLAIRRPVGTLMLTTFVPLDVESEDDVLEELFDPDVLPDEFPFP